jgi:signal transduction histidine kinase
MSEANEQVAIFGHSVKKRVRSSIRVTPIGLVVKRKSSLEQAVVDAVEREHRRFASDLHDGICQELAGIAMTLDSMRPRVGADASTEIQSVSERIRRVTLDAQRLALGLAPIAVERAGLAGALALLKLEAELQRGPAITLSVEERITHGLPLDMAVNLYRIAQEATANARRHSGASQINISLEVRSEGLLLAVQDDGCGVGTKRSELRGLGIASMVSRAKWLGGELGILSSSPRGTRVQVIVPMDLRDRT